MANRRYSSQFRFSFHKFPVQLDASFTVDADDTAGAGITGLDTEGITAVYMHTSATPATGSPNPDAGYILVKFSDSYNKVINVESDRRSPTSGSDISTGLNVGTPYVISALGSTTTAQWQTAGLPTNMTPAVGQSFIAAATSVAGGGTVQASSVSGIDSIEVVGDPNATLRSTTPGQGGYVVLQCLLDGVVTAPADGTEIDLSFLLSNSNLY